jgi:hypothetical protein
MSGIVTQNTLGSSGLVKAVEAGGGTWVEIETLTSDGSDSSLSFTSGIDSTYPIYCFQFINIHAETNDTQLSWQVNASGQSGFNETIQSTFFDAYHNEGNTAALGYRYIVGFDQANGTGYQYLGVLGGDSDFNGNGFLYLFNPSSTTFVKHFISRLSAGENLYAKDLNCGGYINTTAAITEIDFKMSADEIQGGKIKMFGLKDS